MVSLIEASDLSYATTIGTLCTKEAKRIHTFKLLVSKLLGGGSRRFGQCPKFRSFFFFEGFPMEFVFDNLKDKDFLILSSYLKYEVSQKKILTLIQLIVMGGGEGRRTQSLKNTYVLAYYTTILFGHVEKDVVTVLREDIKKKNWENQMFENRGALWTSYLMT